MPKAVRVPVPNVSAIDLTACLQRPASVAAINAVLRAAADDNLASRLALLRRPARLTDFIHTARIRPSWTPARRG